MFDWYLKQDLPDIYKYKIDWLRRPDLESQMIAWMQSLADVGFLARKYHDLHRKQLAFEFYEVLQHYAYALNFRIERLRGRSVKRLANLTREVTKVDRALDRFPTLFRQHFGTGLNEYLTNDRLIKLTENVTAFNKKVGEAEQLQDALVAKLELVDFWLNDLRNGSDPSVIDALSIAYEKKGLSGRAEYRANVEAGYEDDLLVVFLGNAPSEKCRLYLDVLLKDTESIFRNPSRIQTESVTGFEINAPKVEKSVEDFRKVIKAEAGAFAGIKRSGKFEFECKGVKAAVKAEALAGAGISAGGALSYGGDGISAKAEVEALIGVRVKIDAELEAGDLFLLEAGVDAFAGALASAKFEFTVNGQELKANFEAEFFAGARITGKAAVGFKFGGQEIMKGELEGSLTAGIGANFKFSFESSGAGGQKLELDAGLTIGVGAEGKAKVSFNTWTASVALRSIGYYAYGAMFYDETERKVQREYFSGLQANEKYLEWTKNRLEAYMPQAKVRYDAVIAGSKVQGLIHKSAKEAQMSV